MNLPAYIPFPAGPTALPSQLATNPNPATGPASNSAPHTAPSPAVTHNAPAGASYNGDAHVL